MKNTRTTYHVVKRTEAEKKTRVNKAVVAPDAYKARAIAYFNSIRSRQSVEHSMTPTTQKRDGKDLPTSILVGELTTIVTTANKLNKFVVLGINSGNLVILLEDKVPTVPRDLF